MISINGAKGHVELAGRFVELMSELGMTIQALRESAEEHGISRDEFKGMLDRAVDYAVYDKLPDTPSEDEIKERLLDDFKDFLDDLFSASVEEDED